MSHQENIQFKGFSPLRTPDVLKFVKRKKRRKDHVSEKILQEIPDSEGEITKDLLKLASKVSGKLSSTKKDKFAFRSSDLPVDIDITPERKKRLGARLVGQIHQDTSIDTDFQMTIGKSEKHTFAMRQKSPKKHRQQNTHSMSDSDNEVKNVPVSVDGHDQEDICGSPSILSGLNNTLDKSSSRKKHKSHKKHKKRKHDDDSRNVSQDLSETTSDVVDSSPQKSLDRSSPQKSLDRSSPQKSLDRSSPQKRVDKTPQKWETPARTKHHNANQSGVSEEEGDASGGELVTRPVLKYKVPENFTCSSHPTKALLSSEVVQGNELWLIKAPSDFDMSRLNGQEMSLDKISHLQTEDVVMDTFPVPGDISGVSYCPMLPSKKLKKLSVGTRFCGQLHVTTSVTVPTLPKVKAPPLKHIATPDNLRPRFVPFGANIDVHSCPDTQVKCKKTKKRKHSADETDDVSIRHKKKKKKHKH